ncbi:MAG: transposase [Actinobacteria bacterium]|nr:transposase [Actinomycetota bacterium]
MKRKRHTPEQVIRKLREAECLLEEGIELPEVMRRLEISVQTYHRWKHQYHSMRPEDVVVLKNLQKRTPA